MATLNATLRGPALWPARSVERLVGVGAVAAAALSVIANSTVCHWEATLSQHVLSWFHLVSDSHSAGSTVVFASNHAYIGFLVTPGCSVAMLLAPFLVLTGVLLWIGRGSPRWLMIAMVSLVVLFTFTNQLRLAAIAVSMDQLGFQRGYNLSHVTFGSIISAVGFMAGVVVFVVALTREARPPKRRGAHA